MDFIQPLFADLPMQVVQSVVLDIVVAIVIASGLTIVQLARKGGVGLVAGAQTFSTNISSAMMEAIRGLGRIGSYNPFEFLRKAVIWLLFLILLPIKYLGPIVFLYLAFSYYFSGIEESDFRSIYVLPGVIMGILLSLHIGRALIGGMGWAFICLPLLGYLGIVAMLNLTYWLTVPMVALASVFFNISLGDYLALIAEEAPYFAEGSLYWGTKGIFAALGNVFSTASPPLAGIAIYACILAATIVSLMLIIPPLAYLYYNRLPGPKLNQLDADARAQRLERMRKARAS